MGIFGVPHVLPLPILRLRLRFRAESEVAFAAFAGSAWRGALGHALKRLVCAMRTRRLCEGCPLEFSCIHTTVFEARPPPDADRMRRYVRIPHPFVLDPLTPTPCRLRPGEVFELELRLFGRAADHAVYLVRALAEAAARGVGAGRGRLALEAVRDGWNGAEEAPRPRPPAAPPAPRRIEVRLDRPLRLAVEGRLLSPERFRPGPFLMALVRRTSLLCAFHGEAPLELDFRRLREIAHGLEAEHATLAWREQRRRSARQGGLVPMGGIVGRFVLDLAGAEAFWPFLHAGRWLHLGKGATMGMGRIGVGAAGLPAAAMAGASTISHHEDRTTGVR